MHTLTEKHRDIMYVDVRDIAFAHILALQKPAASANRFIIAGDLFAWQDFGKVLSTINK